MTSPSGPAGDGEFLLVVGRKGRSGRRGGHRAQPTGVTSATQFGELQARHSEDREQAFIARCLPSKRGVEQSSEAKAVFWLGLLASAQKQVGSSQFFVACHQALAAELAAFGVDVAFVCYGIGNFFSEPKALQQLALLMELHAALPAAAQPIELYDPALTALELSLLSRLPRPCRLAAGNEEGRRTAGADGQPLVAFMPHCPRGLYDRLLEANWRPDCLGRLLVIGNSFQAYADRPRTYGAPFLEAASKLGVVCERPLPGSSPLPEAFNDTVLMSFPASSMPGAAHDCWSMVRAAADAVDAEIIQGGPTRDAENIQGGPKRDAAVGLSSDNG